MDTWLKSTVARSSLRTHRSTSATFPAATHCSTRACSGQEMMSDSARRLEIWAKHLHLIANIHNVQGGLQRLTEVDFVRRECGAICKRICSGCRLKIAYFCDDPLLSHLCVHLPLALQLFYTKPRQLDDFKTLGDIKSGNTQEHLLTPA